MNYEEFLAKKIESGEQDFQSNRLFSTDEVVNHAVKEIIKCDNQKNSESFRALVAV